MNVSGKGTAVQAARGVSVNGDIELEIGAGSQAGSYAVRVVHAAVGGEPAGTLELDVEGLLGRRELLETTLLASAVARRSVASAERPVREVGQQLFEALFTGPVYGTYRASLGAAQQRGKRLRVVLRLTVPELAAVPWEMLFDPETEAYVCRQEPLVRHVPAPYTVDPVNVRPPLRVLGLIASPRGLATLDVAAEQEHLAEALAQPIAEGLIQVEWIPEATWDGVHARLLDGEWHVLHFVGHGDYDTQADEGVIALVGADGRADPVEASRLADLLGEAEPTPRLVVLNSCSSGRTGVHDLFSGTAAALARSGISAVAAMQFTISDNAAIAFSRGFYTAIAHGRDVDEAARSGRIAILGTPHSLEWVTPVLYMRGQDTQLFTLTAPAAGGGSEPSPPPVTQPDRPADAPGDPDPAPGEPGEDAAAPVPARRAWLRPLRRRAVVISAAVAAVAIGVGLAIYAFARGSPPSTPLGWPVAVGGVIFSRPFVSNGDVYIGDDNGHVYALDAATGRRLWTYPRNGHIGAVDFRPQVASGIVYVGSQDGSVYAIYCRTGRLKWQVKTGAAVLSSVDDIKGVLYFGGANDNLQALNINDGSKYWQQPAPLAGFFQHGPSVYSREVPSMPRRSRTVYVGAGGFFYAMNAASGKISWKQQIGSGDYSQPSVSPDGNTIYVGGSGPAIYALDTATGVLRWKHPYRLRAAVETPQATSEAIYFASGDYVYSVTPGGTDYWRPRNFGTPVSGVFVADGSVYVGAGDSIYCLDATTGDRCQGWRSYTASGQVTAPIRNNGMVYFATQDGQVYALELDGSLARPAG
jgi:outer membrane protein assembly factor BamB